jgi:hypothetical protein
MVIKSCTCWKKCQCFYFWDWLQQNYNGNQFEIKYQKVGLLHTKRKQHSFCEDSNGYMLYMCYTTNNVTWIKYKMTLAGCTHVLYMFDFFGI